MANLLTSVSANGIGRFKDLLNNRNFAIGEVTAEDDRGREIKAKPNSFGIISWIYEMEYHSKFPSPGNDTYNIAGSDECPGYLDCLMFQNVLEDNEFRLIKDTELCVVGDIATLQRIPKKSDYGCLDIWKAGMYSGNIANSVLDVFGYDDVSRMFGKSEWDWHKMTWNNDTEIRFWRRDRSK